MDFDFLLGLFRILLDNAGLPLPGELLLLAFGALVWAALFILAGYSVGFQLEGVHHEYRAASRVLAVTLGAGVAAYLLLKLYRRHGLGSLRERMVARVRKALRPSETIISERNGAGLTGQCVLQGDEGKVARRAQASPTSEGERRR